MDYFVGLDVSLRSVAICVIDAEGNAVLERSAACEIEEIVHCLARFNASELWIGFEAGAMSQHLFFGLQAAGLNVVCMEARQVNAALSAMRNKTDKTDSRGIANVLCCGWFNPVHMKSREAHAVCALLSSRKAVQRKCIDLANEILGLFRIFGLRLPSRIDQASFDERVRPIIEADPEPSSPLHASLLSLCTACGQTTPSSVRDRWRAQYELNLRESMTGSSLTGRGLRHLVHASMHCLVTDDAENGCCAIQSARLSWALRDRSDTCMQRSNRTGPTMTAKRSLTRMRDPILRNGNETMK